MSINYLIIRKNNLPYLFSDIIFLFIINNLFNSSNLIIILSIWLLISFILGRYHTSSIKFFKTFLNSIWLFLITSLVFLFCLSIINFFIQNVIFDLNRLDQEFLIYGLLNIFVSSIIYHYLSKFKKKENFLFIGSVTAYKRLKEFISYTHKYDLLHFNSISDLKNYVMGKNCPIIIYDNKTFLKINSKEIQDLKFKKYTFLSNIEFQEQFLFRVQPELIASVSYLKRSFNSEFYKLLQFRIKRFFDILVSLFLIIITYPLLIFSAFLVFIEDGLPLLFIQSRTGKDLNLFKVIKLRTMKINSEKDGPKWSKANDVRITNVGRFIRLSRIDELPQLFMVLQGKMSLIGPRPERPEFDKQIVKEIPNFNYRYNVLPGISGWAQVNYPYGASIKDSYHKLSYDLFYIRNFSILLDLIIFIKTIKIVSTLKGAIAKK